jgi:hypothetical protein
MPFLGVKTEGDAGGDYTRTFALLKRARFSRLPRLVRGAENTGIPIKTFSRP